MKNKGNLKIVESYQPLYCSDCGKEIAEDIE